MFKVIWDKENNGVRLTMAPPSGEALNVCPRPVFWEELDFLGLNRIGWKYPHCEEPLLWACDRRYFYKGEFVLETIGGNLFDSPKVNSIVANIALEPTNLTLLSEVNEDSLFLIEHEAMEFIDQVFDSHVTKKKSNPNIEYEQLTIKLNEKSHQRHTIVLEDCGSFDIMPEDEVEKQGKRKIYNSKIESVIVSFSGGKDSQVVLDLVSRVIPPDRYYVIYSDTGYELPTSLSLYDEIRDKYQAVYPSLQFLTAKNHQPVLYYWDELDTPSKIHRWCCAVMKTAPLYRLLKEISGKGRQPNVIAFEGVRAEESSTRATYARIGKGVKHSNVVNVRPIFDWSVTEVWLYILTHNLPINKAYRKGLNRVGCVICPLSSELGDCLDHKFFPQTAKPFIEKLGIEVTFDIEEKDDNEPTTTSSAQKIKHSNNVAVIGRAKYSLNGGEPQNKRRIVHSVVSLYMKLHPRVTWREMLDVFPKELQGSYGVINTVESIQYRIKKGFDDENRYFLGSSNQFTTIDGVEFAVCHQWGGQFDKFCEYVEDKFGWIIEKV